MKRLFTFLFIAFGAMPLLFAQVKMTKASHGFLTGQNHECKTVQYQSPGDAGENRLWDYSRATVLEDPVSVANLEENDTESNVKANRNDGCEFFFNNTEKANEYWGYKAGNVKLQLTEPIVKTKYPQTYNTQFSGKYEGVLTVEGSDYSRPVSGTYSTHADAAGVIVLPNELALPALRVRTTEGNGSYELVKYLWYAQNVRLPIFVTMEEYAIAADGIRTLRKEHSYWNTQATSEAKVPAENQDLLNDFSYKVFPNPFQNEIQLSYSLSERTQVTVELYGPGGTKLVTLVSQTQNGNQTISKNVSKYAKLPGVYLLKITAGNSTYTEKLVKAY
jgi:hypothetical protein